MQYMITASALVVAALLIGLVALGVARGYNVKIALRNFLMLELTRPWQQSRSQPGSEPQVAIHASRDVHAASQGQAGIDDAAINSLDN
jgi:hypothetical protein